MAILALNFEYLRHPLAVLPLLRRPPGPHHHRVYDRSASEVHWGVCHYREDFVLGLWQEEFSIRCKDQCIVGALTKIGVSSGFGYNQHEVLGSVPTDNDVAEELEVLIHPDCG